MITLLSHRPTTADFYRVDVSYNLFGEYTVIREWGRRGKAGRHMIVWFSNLREAAVAADRWHRRACARGYAPSESRFFDAA
ncbi:MAG: WGR domain-containing protein [Roseinatronobacter sp.]